MGIDLYSNRHYNKNVSYPGNKERKMRRVSLRVYDEDDGSYGKERHPFSGQADEGPEKSPGGDAHDAPAGKQGHGVRH